MTAAQRAGILVTVATFRRPDGLVALLRSLERMVDAPPFDVLVVDNDPRHSATPAVDGVRGELGFPVRLVAEPAPGIAAARNAALRAADTYRWVCFVDDDEEVDPGWLLRLTDVRRRSDADGVTGPVEFSFAVDPPRWALLGNFFIRPDFADGAPCPTAATNNLLLSVDALRARDLRFDLRLGTTGGSDIMLTRQLTSRGGRIVWCEGAVVHETVPAARCRPRWILRRAVRSGNTEALVALALATSAPARFAVLLGGLARIVVGSGRLVTAPLVNRQQRGAAALRTLLRGIGVVAAWSGRPVREYARPVPQEHR